MTERIVLRVALGAHAHVRPLKDGTVVSDRIRFEFVEFDPLPKAFRTMVRDGELDVSEMALTTHLLALEFGKPLTALPIPLWRRLHHGNLVTLADSNLRGPKDLEGKKVGVRAYSQTTGVWIRGILQHEYGVGLESITWVTMEDAHVAEYRDPPHAVPDSSGRGLRELLRTGEIAAIMGERNVDPRDVRPVISDSEQAAAEWSQRTGVFPVNHVVTVRVELLARHPWLAGELTRMFEKARALAGATEPPYGLPPNRKAMQMLCDFAAEQKLTTRPYHVDDVFQLSAQRR